MCCSWKLIHLCGVFLSLLSSTDCVRLNGIVRLSCDECKLNPNKCCVGTVIAPKVIITTKFCAISCQFVIKKNKLSPIIKYYTYPRDRHYLHERKSNEKRKDIALIILNSCTSKHYVKISAVEPLSAIGLRAFIPVFEGNHPQLKETVVMPCDKRYDTSRGYYICTSKMFGEQIKTVEGMPLLVNGDILGISGSDYNYPTQHTFIAVGPLLYWIAATLSNRKEEKQIVLRTVLDFTSQDKLSTKFIGTMITSANKEHSLGDFDILNTTFKYIEKHENNTIANNVSDIYKESTKQPSLNQTKESKNATQSSMPSNETTHKLDFLKRFISENLSSNQTRHKMVSLKLSISNHTTHKPVSLQSSKPGNISKATTKIHKFLFKKKLNLWDFIRNSTNIRESSTTATTTTTANSLSVAKSVGPTRTPNPTIKTLTTNLMQWFESKKAALKNQPSILILTTTSTRLMHTTEFVDLT